MATKKIASGIKNALIRKEKHDVKDLHVVEVEIKDGGRDFVTRCVTQRNNKQQKTIAKHIRPT